MCVSPTSTGSQTPSPNHSAETPLQVSLDMICVKRLKYIGHIVDANAFMTLVLSDVGIHNHRALQVFPSAVVEPYRTLSKHAKYTHFR